MVCFSTKPYTELLFPITGHSGTIDCLQTDKRVWLVIWTRLEDRALTPSVDEDPLLTDVVVDSGTDINCRVKRSCCNFFWRYVFVINISVCLALLGI